MREQAHRDLELGLEARRFDAEVADLVRPVGAKPGGQIANRRQKQQPKRQIAESGDPPSHGGDPSHAATGDISAGKHGLSAAASSDQIRNEVQRVAHIGIDGHDDISGRGGEACHQRGADPSVHRVSKNPYLRLAAGPVEQQVGGAIR